MEDKSISEIIKTLKNESDNERAKKILQKAIDDLEKVDVSQMPELDNFEKRMIRETKFIRAVKAYGDRNNCGVVKAKIMCENYKNSIVKV